MDNPRQYISLQSMPSIISHVGLKITSRSSNPNYTCEFPQRNDVARQNYARRKYQIGQCGYHSPVYKPYNELGKVVLNSKELILDTLGQKESKKECESTSSESDDDDLIERAESQEDNCTQNIVQNKVKNLRTVEKQLERSSSIIQKVRLGKSLFDLIDREKEEEEREAHLKKIRELKERRTRMVSAKTRDAYESSLDSDEDDVDIMKYVIPSPEPSSAVADMSLSENVNSPYISSSSLVPTKTPLTRSTFTLQSTTPPNKRCEARYSIAPSLPVSPYMGQMKNEKIRVKKNKPRPFSPLYNNLNFYRATNSNTLFRQLCALNWILEAMSQDHNPPIMCSISTCWNIKDLKDDPKILQKRTEKEKLADPIWQSFLSNPSKFQFKSCKRHQIRQSSLIKSTSMSTKSVSIGQRLDHLSTYSEDQLSLPSKVTGSKDCEESINLSNKVKTEEENNQDHWKEIRESYKFEPSLINTLKIKEKGKINVEEMQHIPNKMKEGFSDLKNEQAVILHDNLEAKERTRLKDYEFKLKTLTVMNKLYITLKTIRTSEETDNHTRNELNEREKHKNEENTENCMWYKEMVCSLPEQLLKERSISLILRKLQRFCTLEGRKISYSHFIRAISILRPFELCYPDVSAAIEFVRDKIVRIDKKEFESWCKKRTKRSHSAPQSKLC